MARKTHKPEARYRLRIDQHELRGERWGGAWTFTCTFPGLAEKYAGVADASPAIEEFTRRAEAASGQPAAAGPGLFDGVA